MKHFCLLSFSKRNDFALAWKDGAHDETVLLGTSSTVARRLVEYSTCSSTRPSYNGGTVCSRDDL